MEQRQVEEIVDKRVVTTATTNEMEKIVDRRKSQKVTQYLVKWKGLDSILNTWVPEEHLPSDADAMVINFQEKWQAEIGAQRLRTSTQTNQLPTIRIAEIQAILDRRRRQKVTQYLVKWKSHDASWVPADQLPNGSALMVQACEATWRAAIRAQRECLGTHVWQSAL